MKTIAYLLALLPAVLLLSCGGGDSSNANKVCQVLDQKGCTIASQNQCTHEIMQEYYLWYQQVEPVIDYSAFHSPAETLDFLRYSAPGPDRFSYITSEDYYVSRMDNGEYVGFGFSPITDSDGRVWVRFVYQDSSAGHGGMQRGDEILSINGQTLTSITSNPDWADILGPELAGYQINVVLKKANGSTVPLQLTKAVVNINTVLHSSIIDSGAIKTGYVVFQGFLETSNAELAQLFAQFNAAGVNRVILDLRYNGGGRVSVANNLASYLYKVNDNSQVFNQLTFNDKHQEENVAYHLTPLVDALSIDQLVVITSGETCSASEMVINGLSPYLAVKTVGSTTCGKPVGMNPFFFCSNAMLPITFQAVNSNAQGDYFNGIAADCAASDDVSISFGDATDPMLAQARYLAENGSCMPVAARAAAKGVTIPAHKATGSIREIVGAY